MIKIQYKKTTISVRLLKGLVVLIVAALFVPSGQASRSSDGPVQLTFHPAKTSDSNQKYSLLPKDEDLIDADAAPLYEKAVASLPEDLNTKQINQWRKSPPDQLPQKQVQAILQKFKPSLQLLEQAAKCKRCDWTYEAIQKLTEFRNMAFLLTHQIHFETAQGQYDNAINTMQTGFALAKNISKEPTIIPGMVAVAISALISGQIEQVIQSPEMPTLYQALRDLPQPLIDLNSQLEIEEPDIAQKVHLLTNRLDRHIATLQCIEALRLSAGTHDGKFPEKLDDVTNIEIPLDPVTNKPFSYTSTGTEAVLELKPTEGSEGRDAIRYELKLKE